MSLFKCVYCVSMSAGSVASVSVSPSEVGVASVSVSPRTKGVAFL